MDKMKIINYLIGLILVSFIAVASAPPVPMPFVIYITSDGATVKDLNVKFICDSNSLTRQTNENGGAMVDISSGGDFPCTSILSIDCGYAACQKNYNINAIESPYKETISLTGYVPPSTPPVIPPEVEDKASSNEDKSIASVDAFFGQVVELFLKNNKLSKL